MFLGGLLGIILLALICVPCVYLSSSWVIAELKYNDFIKNGANVAFFHPFCMDGGEKEKSLWMAVNCLVNSNLDVHTHIYSVVTAEPQAILDCVQRQFNITIDPDKIKFITLKCKGCISSKSLFGQCFGSVFTAFEAFSKHNPHVYIDTSGYPFTYPVFRVFAQCPVGCIVHPVITTAPSGISSVPPFKWFKAVYVGTFAWWSDVTSRCAQVIMVNAARTRDPRIHPGYGSFDVETAMPSTSYLDEPAELPANDDDEPPSNPETTTRVNIRSLSDPDRLMKARVYLDYKSQEEFDKTFMKGFRILYDYLF